MPSGETACKRPKVILRAMRWRGLGIVTLHNVPAAIVTMTNERSATRFNEFRPDILAAGAAAGTYFIFAKCS
jgi:hypothetical protein